jgi:hypothetical protein
MKPRLFSITLAFCLLISIGFLGSTSSAISAGHDPSHYTGRKGNVSGYYLGFRSLSEGMRNLRRPKDIPVTNDFMKNFYLDFLYAKQEFNEDWLPSGEIAEHELYGITLGFTLGDNPNLDIRIPIAAADFDVGGLDDTGAVMGIEFFPNYRINQYVAWGVKVAYTESFSDFPVFDESMSSAAFMVSAESSEAYGMNWSGRLSIGRYFPSNDINDDAFWLYRASLGLHYHLHKNFTLFPFMRYNISTGESLIDSSWVEIGTEFIFMPNSPWNFSLGIAGVGHHNYIEHGLEFYFASQRHF